MPMTGSAAAAYMTAWRARATPAAGERLAAALLCFRALDEAAGELDARAFGLVATEQALRALGLDLGELIAIDGELGIVGRSRAAQSLASNGRVTAHTTAAANTAKPIHRSMPLSKPHRAAGIGLGCAADKPRRPRQGFCRSATGNARTRRYSRGAQPGAVRFAVARQATLRQVPSGLRQAVPRIVRGRPSI